MKDPVRVATGRIGALRLHGLHDGRALTTKGRAAFLKKFSDEALAADPALAVALASPVDVKREAAEKELERRAGYLRQGYFSLMAYRREQARQKKTAGANTSPAVQEVGRVSGATS